MNALLAVDPGVHKAGVAVAVSGRVDDAATLMVDDPKDMAAAVMAWAEASFPTPTTSIGLVYEVMRDYPGKLARRRDLEDVRHMMRETREAFGTVFRAYSRHHVAVSAHAWKGGVPKDIHHARIYDALTPEEGWAPRTCALLGHDGRDAVGLLLFALNRTGRGGARPD